MSAAKKILAALDGSPHSVETLRYARLLAQNLGAELILITVINQRDVDALEMANKFQAGVDVAGYITNLKEERKKEIAALLAQGPGPAISPRLITRVGVPWVEILDVVKAEGANLIVMGTKGRSNLAGVVLGSQANKIFRRSPVPVLSVRGKEQEELVERLGD